MIFFYVITLFVFLIFAAILFINYFRNEATCWLSASAFCVGLGAFNGIILLNIIPSIYDISNSNIIDYLEVLAAFFNSLSAYFSPYFFLLFAIDYSEIFYSNWYKLKRKLFFLLLIPILLMYLCFPIYDCLKHDSYKPSYTVLALWVTPYICSAIFFLLYPYFKAKNFKRKKEVLRMNIMLLPTVIAALILGYIAVGLGRMDLWEYQILAFIYLFVVFLFFITKQGILGVRLHFEKYRLDSAIQILPSGSVIINHAMKNEVVTISMNANIASELPAVKNNPVLNQCVQTIINSSNRITELVTRLNEHMKEIFLEESAVNLSDLVDQSLIELNVYLSTKNIQVIKNYALDNPVLSCDPVHILEVLHNIIKNAVEAMKDDGKLEIQLYQSHGRIVLAFKDNGAGIPKEDLSRVMEPFFSTKNLKQNFGLGLSYCYKVMQKHGGSLKIHSEENVGTTIFLLFKNTP